jgi:hypothetical protein
VQKKIVFESLTKPIEGMVSFDNFIQKSGNKTNIEPDRCRTISGQVPDKGRIKPEQNEAAFFL